MVEFEDFDWNAGSAEAHLEMARRGTQAQIRSLARTYDWDQHPEEVLGWVMAQKCIDLGTALRVLMNGGPERFNYMPRQDVPEGYRGVARLIDNIVRRLNCGFYLADPDSPISDPKRIRKWLAYQRDDRSEGRLGRWQLEENILEPLLFDTLRLGPVAAEEKKHSLLYDIFSPAIELATKRVVEDEPIPGATSQPQRG